MRSRFLGHLFQDQPKGLIVTRHEHLKTIQLINLMKERHDNLTDARERSRTDRQRLLKSGFLKGVMLASGGYPWTIIPLERRNQYMAALESASVRQDIRPIAEFVSKLVDAGLRDQAPPPLPIGGGGV